MAISDAQYTAWLKSQAAVRCILVEAEVKTGGSVVTRYLSNQGYVTEASDTPANTSYSPRIVGGIQISSKIALDGNVSMSFGDIELNNMDGLLDSWVEDYWANRSIRIYLGDVSWTRADFRQVFGGITTSIDTRKRDRINIKLSDKLQRLNYPASEVKLGGSGILADSNIPLLFGECHNIEPLLVDHVLNEYQVHNGPIEGVFEVRDNGVPVSFTHLPALGKFRLNQAPSGTITCSAQGSAPTQNLFQRSEEFANAFWTKLRATVPITNQTSPIGTTTACKVVEDTAASNTHGVIRSLTPSSGLWYTASIYAKADSRTAVRIVLPSAAFVGAPSAIFELSTGTITTETDCIATISNDLGSGWYRVSVTALADSTTAGNVQFLLATGSSSSYTGNGTSGLFMWGAQFEASATLSRYQVTTTAEANIFPNTIAGIIKLLVTQHGHATNRFTQDDLNQPALEDFDIAHPQAVGIYLKDRANVLEVCNNLAASVGARVVVNSNGQLSIVQLTLPQAQPGTAIGSSDMVLKSLEIAQLVPVVGSVKVGYCKNWTVQETLAAGVVIDSVALFNEEWLSITRTDTAAIDNYILFADPVLEGTYLLTGADATAEADRRLNMFSVQRKVLKYTGFYHLIFEQLGNSQTITHDRFGLSGGITGQIISIAVDLMSPHVGFEVLV
jgi:hypothetical protein